MRCVPLSKRTAQVSDRRVPRKVCHLCGEYINPGEDHSEAGHDGDGMEPCIYGHGGCSMNGRTGGPCRNEYLSEHPDEDDDV